MTLICNILLSVLAVGLLVPVAIVCVECVAALMPRRRSGTQPPAARPRVAVLVPAHDEETGVASTIAALRPQLLDGDRLLVVADNCTDATARVARAAGADVIERNDPLRRGKGYALDFGLNALAADPPDVVVMIDADCHTGPGAVNTLARAAASTGRPVQATNLLEQPSESGSRDCLSALAFTMKNLVRPRGLHRLGLPCMLTGTGMAFPWSVVRQAPLASGNIVEDMQLGIHLAMRGFTTVHCSEARVTGRLPQNSSAASKQRTRWEHGHLQTLLHEVPRLAAAGLRRRSLALVALAADLSVPPLSLLALLMTGGTTLAAAAAACGLWMLPAILLSAGAVLLLGSILTVWAVFARNTLPLGRLLAVPLYMAWKIPIYLSFIVRREKAWVRTERDSAIERKPAAPHEEHHCAESID